jgi:hypothetical protein
MGGHPGHYPGVNQLDMEFLQKCLNDDLISLDNGF